MTSLLENCFFSMPTHSMPTQHAYTVCLAACLIVCLNSMPQYAYTQYPTHSILHSMPHSMLTQYVSVCLHTVSYTQNLTY